MRDAKGEQDFQRVAVQTSEMCRLRAEMPETCGTCLKPTTTPGERFRRCAECKNAKYCSRECQKKDWPRHRQECNEVDRRIPKILKNLLANPFLLRMIEVAIILKLNLLDDPRPNIAIQAEFDVNIEPSSIVDMLNLLRDYRVGKTAKNTEGMTKSMGRNKEPTWK
ncbi:hypothetical protein M422DRAFT_270310 [Sphaerobolus stellatus SS14]|uniref:MYND-type domain-containing protein n=1 Tax=Sphaerobolus stellatus (strain SS14) TaxID=990650 RepID=A0A0C9UHP2_SPHS4|nr:hypothetical protein M422DRAFT_270310 [Sphaerobolus stellatus SS14]